MQLLNWDWLHNRPAQPAAADDALRPGWWQNVRQLLRPPLLDASVPEGRLAAWLDQHTMRVHDAFLDKLSKLQIEEGSGRLVLDDPYWQQLQQLPAKGPTAAVPPSATAAAAAAGTSGS